jgi:hypothetical protein
MFNRITVASKNKVEDRSSLIEIPNMAKVEASELTTEPFETTSKLDLRSECL